MEVLRIQALTLLIRNYQDDEPIFNHFTLWTEKFNLFRINVHSFNSNHVMLRHVHKDPTALLNLIFWISFGQHELKHLALQNFQLVSPHLFNSDRRPWKKRFFILSQMWHGSNAQKKEKLKDWMNWKDWVKPLLLGTPTIRG